MLLRSADRHRSQQRRHDQQFSEDEFVELVNISSKAIELGGATISDAVAVRFYLSTPTTLQPGDSAVVFGGGMPQGASRPGSRSSRHRRCRADFRSTTTAIR